MTNEQLKAIEMWHSWGHRTPANRILTKARDTMLTPLGIICDYIQYDPSGVLSGDFPALFMVRRRFKFGDVKVAEFRDLFTPLTPMLKHLTLTMREPFQLGIAMAASGKTDEVNYRAAMQAIDAGLEEEINAYFDAAIDAFRATVNLAFTSLIMEETQAKCVPLFLADPEGYYLELRDDVGRLMTS